MKKIRYKIVFNRSRKLNKRGEGLLQVECSQGKRRIYFTTHTYVTPEQFKDGMVRNIDNADGLNFALYIQMREIEAIELEYIKKGVEVNLPLLKEAVASSVSPAAKLRDFGMSVIEQSERKELTKTNYVTLFNNIDIFRKNVYLTDVDFNFIVAYDKFLRESGIAHNTRISRLRLLRAVMNEARKRDLISGDPFARFKIQNMVSKKGYLTKEQLRKLEKMQLSGKTEIARDAFLVGCYTGLRYSDVKSLRQEHIKDGWITKKMQKTNHIVEIPYVDLFDGKMADLIEKYDGDIGNLTKNVMANTSINQLLRPLLDKIGTEKTITFHSSRHTCATLLGQSGLDITSIQHILGHQKLTTTQIYSEVDKTRISADIKRTLKKKK